MATLKENDFAQITYTGTIKGEGIVFDTTDEKVAKDNGLHNPQASYGPLTICIGKRQGLSGLDKALIGKDVGHEFTIDIAPEDGFGRKSAKLIHLIPTGRFRKEQIQPYPGLQVNIDNQAGTIKTVSGGRTLVDFNHPLAGKELAYTVTITRLVTEPKEKLEGFMKQSLAIHGTEIAVEGNSATITLAVEIPEEIQKALSQQIKEAIPELAVITFAEKEADTKKDVGDPSKNLNRGSTQE